MKKSLVFASIIALPGFIFAQSAIDAYRLSQPDLKGTARFMGMAGAFTALGGDLSTLSQNPGGIGVYRNSDVGFTLDLDCQSSTSRVPGQNNKFTIDQTKFLLNNIGFVWTMRLPSSTCPNINFGFTYNKSTSFNRQYSGSIGLDNSLSNLIAANATSKGIKADYLLPSNGYDPYWDSDYNWLPILAYQSYLINSVSDNSYIGQWGPETYGTGYFDVYESGAVDSYNIALGGNIADIVFWGMDFDVTHMNYNLYTVWQENLDNAQMPNADWVLHHQQSDWALENLYSCKGTGFNYKLGFIVKPIQELRLGFSFATPTWYNLTENYSAAVSYQNGTKPEVDNETEFYAPSAYDDFSLRTPWKINVGLAGVLFNRLIVSADYEWNNYGKMKYSEPTYYNDPWTDNPWAPFYSADIVTRSGHILSPEYDPYAESNSKIREYYKSTNTIRLGAEFRVTNRFSVRAGYSYVTSPASSYLKKSEDRVVTAGTLPNYRVDNSTNYITCGLGYNYKGLYIDAAYVYKHMDSEFHAYSALPGTKENPQSRIPSPKSSLSLNNSQIVLSAGYKF